jgi:hypothetical protein
MNREQMLNRLRFRLVGVFELLHVCRSEEAQKAVCEYREYLLEEIARVRDGDESLRGPENL